MKIDSKLEIVELMKHFGLPLIAAEVGVAEGRWSYDLLRLGIEKLYLIDVWETVPFIDGCASWEQKWHDDNYNAVIERLKDYKDRTVVLKGFSYQMAKEIPDESLGHVHVDCDHTYNGVKSDIKYYWPKLVEGGIMTLHDYANPEYGVWRAVREFAQQNNLEINMLKENGELSNIGCWIQKIKKDGV